MHDGFDGIVGLQHIHPGAGRASLGQLFFHFGVVLLGRVRLSHINGQDIAMKARRTLTGACDHAISVRVRCQADQEAFLGT